MSVLGGCGCLGGGGIVVGEEFVEGDGFVAAGACAAVADSGHEDVAFVASLAAQGACVTVGALVDGVGSSGGFRGYGRGGHGLGVAVAVGGLSAGVGAPLACTAGGQRSLAGHTPPFRYVSVTRRGHVQSLFWLGRPWLGWYVHVFWW